MRHFPAFLDLRGRLVLLLGEGEALEAKADMTRAALQSKLPDQT